MKKCVRAFVAALALLATCHHVGAANVSLVWTASTSTNVTGYNVYYGTNSGDYTSKINLGNVANVTISNLTAGIAYYFAATAVDSNGDESGYSNEARFISAGILTISQEAEAGSPWMLSFPVEPSHWYEIQATVDFQSWTTIGQTGVASSNAWVQFSDPAASASSLRFYRLVLH